MATALQLANLKQAVPLAQASMARWKVPASVTLAQWTLESAWGQSQLAREANNFFGVKALQGEAYREFPTREVVQGRSIVELQRFAFYPTPAESFNRHAQLLASLPRYLPAMACAGDVRAFCKGLVEGGYSTDPGYAARLTALIDELNLTRYDQPLPAPVKETP